MSAFLNAHLAFDGAAPVYISKQGHLAGDESGEVVAIVTTEGLMISARGSDGLAGMTRLADALLGAVAQARQARQDVDLADLAVIS